MRAWPPGELTPEQRDQLTACVSALQARLNHDLWLDDQAEYFRVRDLLLVAGHVMAASTA
jgi:hypothetical protein